jgi:hypothetical protein
MCIAVPASTEAVRLRCCVAITDLSKPLGPDR